MNAPRSMARTFFAGIGWMALALVSGVTAMITFSELSRLSGGRKVLTAIAAAVLAVTALGAFIKGRVAVGRARSLAMQGTVGRFGEKSMQRLQAALEEESRKGHDPSRQVVQLDGAQQLLEQMRLAGRTPEPLSSLAERFDLRLEPMRAMFVDGEGAAVETGETGIALVFFSSPDNSDTTLLAWDQATWAEIVQAVDALAIPSPEWLADPSDFPG